MPSFFQSLKLQILVAILSLTGLFAASAFHSIYVIDQQQSDDALLQLASRLQYKQQLLTVQAMQYQENAPRDYPSYYRDLRLYFQDLKRVYADLDTLVEAFSGNDFAPLLGTDTMAMMPRLPDPSRAIAERLGAAWRAFSSGLDEQIGTDPAEPRLEWAAQWIGTQHAELEQIAAELMQTLASDVSRRAQRANTVNRLLLGFAIIVAFAIALWFYRKVLTPLADAVAGFERVANGEFSHQVPVRQDNEIGWLVRAFNRLSYRLDTLRRLLTRLEQGGDLHATLGILSETLPNLLPVDWIGVLVVGVDGKIYLQRAYSDGEPEPIGQESFDPDQTLLAECIASREPLHIADVRATSQLSDRYAFLRRLCDLGRQDAIFLPIGAQQSVHGVVVFASRLPNSYRAEHLALLRNLGVLLGVSLGRTLQLAENTRLASIGQFASGIAHEIRNPLATIGLALDYLQDLESLPDGAHKRIHLAGDELARLERLLSDILLYAKPLSLERTPQDIARLIVTTVAAELGDSDRVRCDIARCPPVPIDHDRMRQVLINLLRNAVQAAPPDSPIYIHCRCDGAQWIELALRNGGDPIPEKVLERVFEPFVTSRRGGTGLGLAIVRHIVDAHGGEIAICSDHEQGTRVVLRLPVSAPTTSPLANHAAD